MKIKTKIKKTSKQTWNFGETPFMKSLMNVFIVL